jgi:hypothetical protein
MENMKTLFKLEVFKDLNLMVSDKPETTTVKIFESMVPSTILSDVVGQWSALEHGYRIKITFNNGVVITSDEIANVKQASDNFLNIDYPTQIRQEIVDQIV